MQKRGLSGGDFWNPMDSQTKQKQRGKIQAFKNNDEGTDWVIRVLTRGMDRDWKGC